MRIGSGNADEHGRQYGTTEFGHIDWTELSARARSSSARGTKLGTTDKKCRTVESPNPFHKGKDDNAPERRYSHEGCEGEARASVQANAWSVIIQTFRLPRFAITPASNASRSTGQKSANCNFSTTRAW